MKCILRNFLIFPNNFAMPFFQFSTRIECSFTQLQIQRAKILIFPMYLYHHQNACAKYLPCTNSIVRYLAEFR